jgi:hypothetical protein
MLGVVSAITSMRGRMRLGPLPTVLGHHLLPSCPSLTSNYISFCQAVTHTTYPIKYLYPVLCCSELYLKHQTSLAHWLLYPNLYTVLWSSKLYLVTAKPVLYTGYCTQTCTLYSAVQSCTLVTAKPVLYTGYCTQTCTLYSVIQSCTLTVKPVLHTGYCTQTCTLYSGLQSCTSTIKPVLHTGYCTQTCTLYSAVQNCTW